MSSIRVKVICAIFMLSACALFCQAQTNYYVVPANAAAEAPFTNWAMAATNIQEVINRSLAGDTIYLTNGHYRLTNEVLVDKAVIIRSFHDGVTDPTNTILDGNNYPGKPVTNRCLNITAGATIDGLMLTNGNGGTESGGGCSMSGKGMVLMTNCIVTGNSTTNKLDKSGGGIAASAPAVVTHCRIVGNKSDSWGGGIQMVQATSVLKDSFIGWNEIDNNLRDGAGVAIAGSISVLNCSIVSNSSDMSTVFFYGSDSVLSNCVIRGNMKGSPIRARQSTCLNNQVLNCEIINNRSSVVARPAAGYLSYDMLYRNCLIASNQASGSYGGLFVMNGSAGRVESCTIVGNQGLTCGGVYAEADSEGYFYNTIISSNVGGTYSDLGLLDTDATNNFFHCCCPTVDLAPEQGNIQQSPAFADFVAGNYRLSLRSPCVDAGLNDDWMQSGIDLDGGPRIQHGQVDMGAYELLKIGGAILTVW